MSKISNTFMFVQLLAVALTATASVEVSPTSPVVDNDQKSAAIAPTQWKVGDAMFDASLEALLALVMFCTGSTLLGRYRKDSGKKSKGKPVVKMIHEDRPKQAKHIEEPTEELMVDAKKAAPWKARVSKKASATPSLDKFEKKFDQPKRKVDPTANFDPKEALAAWKQKKASEPSKMLGPLLTMDHKTNPEADSLAIAVRQGRAAELPALLDQAMERSKPALAQEGAISHEEHVGQLLLAALRACAASRCFREGVALYEHVSWRIGGGNTNIWSVLLYCIVETASWQHSEHVLEKLCSAGPPTSHDFVNMVRCYAGRFDAEGLQKRFEKMSEDEHKVDVYTWNRALAACGAADSSMVLGLAEALVSSKICSDDFDAVGYNTLMKYNARAGKMDRCFEIRTEMTSKGIEASDITYGILLDACVAEKKLDQARQVFSELCTSGLRLNVVHCTTFIKVLVSARLLDEAEKVLKEMIDSPGVKPDLITYSILLKAYSEIGDVPSCLRLLELLIKENIRPDEIVFNSVLTSCCNFPTKGPVVMQTFEALVGFGLRPSTTTLSILLKGLAYSESWDASLQVLKDAPKNFGLEPEARLFSQLAQGCAGRRASKKCLEVFEEMAVAAKRSGKGLDKDTINRFLRSSVLSGASDISNHLRDAIKRHGIAIDMQMDKMLKPNNTRRA